MQPTTRPSPAPALFGIFTLFCTLLLFKNVALVTAAMSRGIELLLHVLIPSLFPFAVLSELLRAIPLTSTLSRLLSRPLCRLLCIGSAGGGALLLGLLCGAPVGAQALMRALDEKEVTKEECERILGVATVPSAAFLIGAVGGGLFTSPAFGVLLLVAVLLSSLLCALLFARGKGAVVPSPPRTVPPIGLSRAVTDAVRTGAKTMLTVSAFVLFFAVLSDAVALVLAGLPEELRATVGALLELSDGVVRTSSLAQKIPAACLTAFAAGWSGLSVHLQVIAICDGRGLSFTRYFLIKATEGVLCALLVLLALCLFSSVL